MEQVPNSTTSTENNEELFIRLFTEIAGFSPEDQRVESNGEGFLFLPLDGRLEEERLCEQKDWLKEIVGDNGWKVRTEDGNGKYLGIWVKPPAPTDKSSVHVRVKDAIEEEVIRIRF